MKRGEGVADLDHAQLQRGVADVLDEPGEDGGRFDQVGLLALLGEQVGRGAGDDQFADEVDQLVELVGLDADQTGFLGLLVVDLGLLDDGRIDDFLLDHLVVYEDLAQLQEWGFVVAAWLLGGLALVGEPLVEFSLGQGAAADEDFAKAHGVLGQFLDVLDVFGELAVGRQDAQVAFVAHEIEHPLDVGLGAARLELDFKADVAGFGIHVGGRRHGFGYGFDAEDFAQRGEVADERERVHAAAQDVLAEAYRDVPAVGENDAAARAFDFHRRFVEGQR